MEAKLLKKLAKENIVSSEILTELLKRITQLDFAQEKVTVIKVNKKETTSEVEKGDLMVAMEYLKETYEKNNEVSKKLVEIIPDLKSIIIYESRCNEMDVPKIWCTKKDEALVGIDVRRSHKIIWQLLNEM